MLGPNQNLNKYNRYNDGYDRPTYNFNNHKENRQTENYHKRFDKPDSLIFQRKSIRKVEKDNKQNDSRQNDKKQNDGTKKDSKQTDNKQNGITVPEILNKMEAQYQGYCDRNTINNDTIVE